VPLSATVQSATSRSELAYTVLRPEEPEFRPPSGRPRSLYGGSSSCRCTRTCATRANLWRYPPGATGRLHREHSQEEVFVVLEGNPALMLGDPPERYDAPAGTLVVVEPGTPLKWLNDSSSDALIFAYGAPAESKAEILES
jgi:mannose-6-phosphate isomerase-like protein (cupin superfamily)